MKSIYEADDFNKVLAFQEFESTASKDFHIFRLETFKKKDVDIQVPLHRQHFMDITLFIDVDTTIEVFFDNKKQQISEYTLQMVPPFKLLSFNIPKEILPTINGFTILFSFDFLSIGLARPDFIKEFDFFKVVTEDCHFKLTKEQANRIVFLFEKMLFEYENNQQRSKQILQGYLWVLLNECKQIYDAAKTLIQDQENAKISQPHQLLQSFQGLIANHIHCTFTVDEYADMLHITPNHLTQSIKEASGKSPKDFINKRRITEAKCLLLYTDNSITEVSHLLNFSEPTHFTKFFKKETGLTPKEFVLSEKK